MELRHIRYFVAVAEELHFGRAAERLHISQPPLSQQIQALEAELGVQLFARSRHKVALTEAGKQFLARAYVVLDEVQQAITAAQRADRGEVGILRIGFTGSFPFTSIMPLIIRNYREAYPGVELRFQERGSMEQIDLLLNNALDLGFTRSLPSMRSPLVAAHSLLTEPLVVALPAKHVLAAKQQLTVPMLVNEQFIMYARPQGAGLYEQVINLCLAAGFAPNVVQEAGEMTTIIGLVAANVGISFVSSAMQKIRVPNVIYRPLKAPGAISEVLLVHRRDEISVLVKEFVKLARAEKRK
ncbi:MAG: LysR substrate-binding domain-containing protein [Pseudomonadota bacterium]